MINLKRICIFVISALILFINTDLFASVLADEQDNDFETIIQKSWHTNKDEAFRLAKEQDKYIFLLIGKYTCPKCHATVVALNDASLSKIIENEYIMWFNLNSLATLEEVQIYIDEMYANMTPTYLPLFFIIDPNDPTKPLKYNWNNKTANYFQTFLAFDLPLKQGLKWYEDTSVLFELAKNQKKLIFKFVGTGTSNNTKEVLKLLESSPLAQILSENYILWYKRHKDTVVTASSDVFTQDEPDNEDNDEDSDDTDTPEEEIQTAPYIYIIDPEKPNENIASIWGLQDIETLKDLLEGALVPNENINYSDNKVTLNNNTLFISNSTDNETISVYSIAGQKIDVIQKNEPSISVSASSFPNGVLIIHSSKGWSAKVVKN